MITSYKQEESLNSFRLFFQIDSLKYDFIRDDSQPKPNDKESLDHNVIREIIVSLIGLQIPPITRKDVGKCKRAYDNISDLRKIFIQFPDQNEEIAQTIDEVVSQNILKDFPNLIHEYINSEIPPAILVQILHLIFSMMICPKSFFMPLFDARFIDLLFCIVDQPQEGIQQVITNLDFPDEDFINPFMEYEDPNNPVMSDFDEVTEASARNYASIILINFFKLFVEMNEEEKSMIELPDFNNALIHVINGVFKTSQPRKESYSSQFVLFLLLVLLADFEEKIKEIDGELLHNLLETLILCVKNPLLLGIEYAHRSLFIINDYIASIEIYTKEDFDGILMAAKNSRYDYHWEFTAFIHSIFFSGNENAIKNMMESIESQDFDLIDYLKFLSEEKSTLYFCRLCRDLLQLLFLEGCEFSITGNDFLCFFDRIGMIDQLVVIAQESEFQLKREAIFILCSASYNFNIDLMHKLVIDLNFIEILTPFITIDFQILVSSICFTYRILTIVNTLDESNAQALFARLVDAKIFDELEDSIQQYELPDPNLKSNYKNKQNGESFEIDEQQAIDDIRGKNAEKSWMAKLVVSSDLQNVLNFRNQINEYFSKSDQ